MRYLVIKDDVVVNAILWDGRRKIEVDGDLVKQTVMPDAQIGWTRQGDVWVNPRPIPEYVAPPDAETVTAKLARIEAKLDAIEASAK